MKKNHKTAPDVKEQILNRIKNEGISVAKAAEEHGVSTRTIYAWLTRGVKEQPSMLEFAKLKRENQALKEMLGEVTMEWKRAQKND